MDKPKFIRYEAESDNLYFYFEPPKSKNCNIEFKLYIKDTKDQDFVPDKSVNYSVNSVQNKQFVSFQTKLINSYNVQFKVLATVSKSGHNRPISGIDFGRIYQVPFPSEFFPNN